MTEPSQSISTTHLNVRIEDRQILSDINCVFPGTGITGLVGQNGSGKSTLLRVLARQLKPTSGEVTFERDDFANLSDRAFARKLAYMPQSVPAAPGMLVRELVALGRYPWHGPLGRFTEQDAQHVQTALEITGTEAFSDRILDTLSGGERQRCWLAMLVAQQASLLLLDEPTSALDLGHQHNMLKLLKRVCSTTGVSAIVVLHDINLTAAYCDTIVALNSGEMVARGAPGAIMTSDVLHRIFGVKMHVAPHPLTNMPYSYVENK